MNNPWHNVSPGDNLDETFLSIIEIPKGSKNKYELDKKTGLLRKGGIFLIRIAWKGLHHTLKL